MDAGPMDVGPSNAAVTGSGPMDPSTMPSRLTGSSAMDTEAMDTDEKNVGFMDAGAFFDKSAIFFANKKRIDQMSQELANDPMVESDEYITKKKSLEELKATNSVVLAEMDAISNYDPLRAVFSIEKLREHVTNNTFFKHGAPQEPWQSDFQDLVKKSIEEMPWRDDAMQKPAISDADAPGTSNAGYLDADALAGPLNSNVKSSSSENSEPIAESSSANVELSDIANSEAIAGTSNSYVGSSETGPSNAPVESSIANVEGSKSDVGTSSANVENAKADDEMIDALPDVF
ncbi:hypothetical protein B9Z55_023392 [Caenorhabditis nigoni]|uniref:Uncharacterized protein n=1 Tax=Caenorhabditis nigoni TaxID=1611254 RepID=A0A2G5SPQ7_9PELO|nr:hypothetical protein B9Z55_023392 [Caenorhabditis nigoni]